MIKHLNRIYKLGYDIEIIWNKQIQITYDFNRISGFEDYEPVSVLIYVHDFWDESLNFQKCLEETCEIFYSWYSDNHKMILKYIENHDITDLNLKCNWVEVMKSMQFIGFNDAAKLINKIKEPNTRNPIGFK